MQLLAHGLTDIGLKRAGNEDAFLLAPLTDPVHDPLLEASTYLGGLPPTGVLLVVSDGIGGCNAGEVASALAIATLQERLNNAGEPPDLPGVFLDAIKATDQAVRDASLLSADRTGMGATLTALWLRPDGAWLGQVGDSRLYRMRSGVMTQLSPEHSPVGRMRLSGELTEEQARRHRFKNVIDQSLGGDPATFLPEVIPLDLASGDVVLLCSDGLTDGLADAEVSPHLIATQDSNISPTEAAANLIEAAKQGSGRDNITVIVGRLM